MASHQASQEINLAFLLAKLWSARFGVAIFVIVITGLVYLFTQTTDPKYQSDAQILIEPQETAFTRPEVEQGDGNRTIDERAIASEVQVMRSRDIADQVIDRLDLADHPYFDPARVSTSMVKSVFILLGLSEDPLLRSPEERVYSKFDSGLTVYNIPGSRVIVVSYESRDPELSARIANAIVDTYQATQRQTQATNTRSATSFLETEIAELRRQVGEAEAAVARFRSGSGLFVGPNETTLSAQQLSELSSELTRARAAESDSRSRAEELRALIAQQGTNVALPESFSTPLTQRLQEEQATLRARIAELSATLLPAHPRIRELNAQLADVGGQIRTEANRIAQRFENEARVAAARASALEDELARLSAEASRIAEAEVELRALEREAAAQRDLLASYLVRFREAATREDAAMLPTNARIIQTAQVAGEPVFPRTLPMIMIAFVGSLAFALLGVMSQAILAGAVRDDSLDIPEMQPDIHRNARFAHAEPVMEAEDRHSTADVVQEPVTPEPEAAPPPQLKTLRTYTLSDADECRLMFSHLRRLGASGVGTRITVGTSDLGVNTGDVALRIARAIAQAGRSVVMLDCVGDLRNTGITPDGPGFYELIMGAVGFDAALHKDPESPLHLVPSGFQQADRSMIADDAADLVLSAFAHTYDSVIVNAGHDPQLLLECAAINDAMVLSGDPVRVQTMAHTLSGIVSRERVLAVRVEGKPVLHAAIPA